MLKIISLLALVSLAPLAAQTTWIVDPIGGPGSNFTQMQPAVDAASDGDTILVRSSFLAGASGFTTSKGLTVVGIDGDVPLITGHTTPVRITGLPAGSTFRMSGFERIADGMLHFIVENCAGEVHLDRIIARETANGPEFGPSLRIHNSDNVTARELVLFGSPAVQIDNSRAILSNCQLGLTLIGIGGGKCINANYSQVDIVEPRFDTGFAVSAAVESLFSDLRVSGSPSSYIFNGPTSPFSGNYAILTNGGTISFDPQIQMSVSFPWGLSIAGTAVQASTSVPGTWARRAVGAADVTLSTVASPNSVVGMAIGAPGLLSATPFGDLGIDQLQPFGFLATQTTPPSGVTTTTLAIPAALTLGSAFAVQAGVLGLNSLELSIPSTFVVF